MAKEEEMVKEKEEQTLENRCPACKASISFDAKSGKWKCEYCGSSFTLEEMQEHSDNASGEKKNQKKEGDSSDHTQYVSYHCESCGAEIIADEETAATFCIYCGNTAILQSKLSGKFSPDQMIPFQKEKKEAVDAFKSLAKGRPFVPKDFTHEGNIEKIRGVYIPFWLYDVKVSGDIVMNAETVEKWTVGKTHYTKTNVFKVTRGGDMMFQKVPVDGSSHFDNDIMNSIEPFSNQKLIPYNHAYLSGFYAEKYDEEGDKVFSEASSRTLNTARGVLKDDAVLYVSKTIVADHLAANEEARSYVLLPVWMVNVKYKNKMYIFAMNGETGKFVGNIPLDLGKVFLYTLIIFVIVMAISIAITYGIFIGG